MPSCQDLKSHEAVSMLDIAYVIESFECGSIRCMGWWSQQINIYYCSTLDYDGLTGRLSIRAFLSAGLIVLVTHIFELLKTSFDYI